MRGGTASVGGGAAFVGEGAVLAGGGTSGSGAGAWMAWMISDTAVSTGMAVNWMDWSAEIRAAGVWAEGDWVMECQFPDGV